MRLVVFDAFCYNSVLTEPLHPRVRAWRYLLYALRCQLLADEVAPEGPVDGEVLLSTAQHHAVHPLLYAFLSRQVEPGLAGIKQDRLRLLQAQHVGRCLYLSRVLLDTLALFSEHGIQAVAFKGPSLAALLYQQQHWRDYLDLDVFVSPQDYPKARALLLQAAYRAEYVLNQQEEKAFMKLTHEMPFLKTDKALRLELHWGIFENYYSQSLDLRSAATVEVELLGERVATFSPEVMFVILVAHGAKHRWASFSWLVDIVVLCQQDLDWLMVSRFIQQLRLRPVLEVLLGTCEHLFHITAPEALERLESKAYAHLAGQLAQELAVNHEPSFLELFSFQFRTKETILDKARYVHAALSKPTLEDWAWWSLPVPLFPLYRIVRPLRLLSSLRE